MALSLFVTGMAAISLYFTNWHNDGFCWYLHNTQLMTSTISLWTLTLASYRTSDTHLAALAKSLYQVAVGVSLAMQIVAYAFFYSEELQLTYYSIAITKLD